MLLFTKSFYVLENTLEADIIRISIRKKVLFMSDREKVYQLLDVVPDAGLFLNNQNHDLKLVNVIQGIQERMVIKCMQQ